MKTPLTLRHITDVSVERTNRWHPSGIHQWSISDWCVAWVGEVGEACNIVKKLNRVRDNIRGNGSISSHKLKARLAEELADAVLYQVLVAASHGIDLEQAVRDKFNKVSKEQGFPERL
jgi:NTP pyrophosphatase (non-canonical NTP hydrolase)